MEMIRRWVLGCGGVGFSAARPVLAPRARVYAMIAALSLAPLQIDRAPVDLPD